MSDTTERAAEIMRQHLGDEAAQNLACLLNDAGLLSSPKDDRQKEPDGGPGLSVIAEIAAERQRQVFAEGWSVEHDDEHDMGELALAAGCYALNAGGSNDVKRSLHPGDENDCAWIPRRWPHNWEAKWWKPKDPRRDLIRAGALIVAEIERLDRAESKHSAAPPLSTSSPDRGEGTELAIAYLDKWLPGLGLDEKDDAVTELAALIGWRDPSQEGNKP